MTKKAFNPDLGSITGKVHKEKKKKATEKKAPKEEPVFIAIPTKNGYIQKDALKCSAKEFLEWAKIVYPFHCWAGVDPKDYEVKKQQGKVNRIQAFHQIVQYHLANMTEEQRDTIH